RDDQQRDRVALYVLYTAPVLRGHRHLGAIRPASQRTERMTEPIVDDELAAPEDVPVDMERQINHALQSFAQQNVQAQWKIGQHAAEIDWLKHRLAEKEQEVEA